MSTVCDSVDYSTNAEFSRGSDEIANWEENVSEDGTLFYVEYIPCGLNKNENARQKRIEFIQRHSLRMSKKSSYQRQSTDVKKKVNDFKFSNINKHEGNIKTLELVITAADRYRFGRRSNAVESMLGFRVIPFPDQSECLMVDNFVHDMPTLLKHGKHTPILRGDWFRSIDDIEIHTSNVEELLLQFIEPTKVTLTFHEYTLMQKTNCHSNDNTECIQKIIKNFSSFTNVFNKLNTAFEIPEQNNSIIFSMMILPPECYHNDEYKNLLFYYPNDIDNNFLFKARGSFLTLNAVLSEELKTKPMASKLSFVNHEYYVCYRNLNNFLVLFSFPCLVLNIYESNMRADELITYMRLNFINMCLESFNNATFCELLYNLCRVQSARLLSRQSKPFAVFEERYKKTSYLPLPKEAQLRVYDALSEMEAMDYRNWNAEPLHTHREFFIYGSVLFYNHYILISHMPVELRQYVEVFLRCRGVFHFVSEQNVQELCIWQEVSIPNSTERYFLTICGQNHLLLAVILKMFVEPNCASGYKIIPSLFYIEEIQETLIHLTQCGIESLAVFWLISNKRPEINDYLLTSDENTEKETKKFETYFKQKMSSSSNFAKENASSSSQPQRTIAYDEEAFLCSSLGGSSTHSLAPSEDDLNKKRLATIDSIGDDSDSSSDWENFTGRNSNLCCPGYEAANQYQITELLWKEINNIMPIKISPGWRNSILHFVYINGTANTVFCPLKVSNEVQFYAKEIHKAFHVVHDILHTNQRFRGVKSKNLNEWDSSLIKEHGITLQIRNNSNEYPTKRFSVVGRLFLYPPQEIYICHRPEVPQNMIEMAFRLSCFSVG